MTATVPTTADPTAILRTQRIELPSWAFGNSGTRFKVFAQRGVPRDPYEKIADAAQVHRFTGVAPTVALHIPWDKVDDYAALARHARDHGVALGTINSNTFQDDDYMLGSVCHPDARIRRKAVDHLLECIDIMDATGSQDLKLWFADGTNYPGQDDIRGRQERLAESLAHDLRAPRPGPADGAGVQVLRARVLRHGRPRLGDRARSTASRSATRRRSSLDTGHHAPGTNIEFIVAQLLRVGRLGAFDFNSRFYADDDLMVGAADPFQLFRIMHEVVIGGGLEPESGVAFMLDQCHNIEPKIPAQIRSVMNVQEATAKALLVDHDALARGPGGGRCPRRERRPDGRLRHRRAAAARRDARRARVWTRTRSPPTRAPGMAERIAAERVGGAAGGLGRMTSPRPARRSSELLDRSNRLGADPRNTNYAGGNTSAKGTAIDPVSGEPVELLWVKGSGGDLGTLTEAGLCRPPARSAARARRRLPRASSARTRWSRPSTTACIGRGGAAPSIDTAMHGLLEPAHVDHLHPDSGIAFATAADGEELTRRCFGDRVAWVPWRRPGFQLGLDIATIQRDRPEAIGVILGGHGITAWGETSEACEANSLEIIRTASGSSAKRGGSDPFGARIPDSGAVAGCRAASPSGRALPVAARPRLDRPHPGRPFHRQ